MIHRCPYCKVDITISDKEIEYGDVICYNCEAIFSVSADIVILAGRWWKKKIFKHIFW